MTCRLWRLFVLEPVVPGRHESHGREAQGKSQENTADENSDDHGITSFFVLRDHDAKTENNPENQFCKSEPP
jgi:hypothetical protein